MHKLHTHTHTHTQCSAMTCRDTVSLSIRGVLNNSVKGKYTRLLGVYSALAWGPAPALKAWCHCQPSPPVLFLALFIAWTCLLHPLPPTSPSWLNLAMMVHMMPNWVQKVMMCVFNQACVHNILNKKEDLCQLCIVPAFCLSIFLPHLFLLILSFSPNSCSCQPCQLFWWSTVAVLRCRSLKAISSSRVRLWTSHSHYPATGARGLHRISITSIYTPHMAPALFYQQCVGKTSICTLTTEKLSHIVQC